LFSQDVLEDLRHNSDIVEVVGAYVALRTSGANMVGLCPFHQEKSPSFSVSAHRQLFYCFGCGEGGNVYSFIMKIENFTFTDAVRHLADRINYRLPETRGASPVSVEEKNRMYEAYKLSARFYYENLQGSEALEYVDGRGLSPQVQRKFGLGYSTGGDALTRHLRELGFLDEFLVKAGLSMEGTRGLYDRFRGRLMFPIFEVSGKVIGFGGRIIGDGEPKYLNSPETMIFDKSRTLYGLNLARLAKKRTFILVEGYMDVIALYQAGIKTAVAALGTAFTAGHGRLLKRYCDDVIILFDSDAAGVKAVLRAIPHLYAAGLGIQVVKLDGAKDPDDFIKEFGVNALVDELRGAQDFVNFQILHALYGVDMEVTASRIAFTRESAGIIARLGSPVERAAYARDMAAKFGMDEGALKEEIQEILGSKDAVGGDFVPRAARASVGMREGKGHSDAVAHIFGAMFSSDVLCQKIIAHLTGEEFGEPVLKQLFDFIVQSRAAGKVPMQADILIHFENDEELKQLNRILMSDHDYEDAEGAIAQQVQFLKESHLNNLLKTSQELSEIGRLKKELNELKSNKIQF